MGTPDAPAPLGACLHSPPASVCSGHNPGHGQPWSAWPQRLCLLAARQRPSPPWTRAHLQAPTALTPLQQLRRMAPAPGLQLPDPLRPARQALRDEMVDEQGIASWYGPGLHGRRTASGERFIPHDFTAAHPHDAFGTRLCVLSRDGKAVEVRVNDRGPYCEKPHHRPQPCSGRSAGHGR